MTELWYYKQYNNLIAKCQEMEKDGYPEGMYTEVHHILPKCQGGTDEKCNLVRMPARYHIFAHIFLMKAFPDNSSLTYAANMMFSTNGNSLENRLAVVKKFSSILIAEVRAEVSKKRSERMKGENHPLYGTHPSKETKEKIQQKHLGYRYENISDELKSKRSKITTLNNPRKGVHTFQKKRKVIDVNTGIVYESISSLAKSLNRPESTIRNWINKFPQMGYKFYTE